MSSIKLWLVEGRRASRGEVVEAGGGAALVLAVLTHHHPPRPYSRAGPPRRHKLVIGLIAAPGREGSRLPVIKVRSRSDDFFHDGVGG